MCAYIMMERKKDPGDREYDAMIDNFPKLNKNIALCRIDVKHSEMEMEVEVGKIDGHQKRIPAKIVPFPFYDPEKKKVRS